MTLNINACASGNMGARTLRKANADASRTHGSDIADRIERAGTSLVLSEKAIVAPKKIGGGSS